MNGIQSKNKAVVEFTLQPHFVFEKWNFYNQAHSVNVPRDTMAYEDDSA